MSIYHITNYLVNMCMEIICYQTNMRDLCSEQSHIHTHTVEVITCLFCVYIVMPFRLKIEKKKNTYSNIYIFRMVYTICFFCASFFLSSIAIHSYTHTSSVFYYMGVCNALQDYVPTI